MTRTCRSGRGEFHLCFYFMDTRLLDPDNVCLDVDLGPRQIIDTIATC